MIIAYSGLILIAIWVSFWITNSHIDNVRDEIIKAIKEQGKK